jgi:hypothetical protein
MAARSLWPQLCSPLFLHAEYLGHLLAHHVFLDLSGHSHRKFVHETDVTWYLEVGDVIAAIVTDYIRIHVGAAAQSDPGAEFFAVPGIGNTEYLNVLHCGMPVEKFLNFARIDVLTAADNVRLRNIVGIRWGMLLSGMATCLKV